MTHLNARFGPTKLREAKALKTARAQLDESARMIARQKVLLEEAGPNGSALPQIQQSLIRLEAGYKASRAALDALEVASKVSSKESNVRSTTSVPGRDEGPPPPPIRSSRPQPSWFRSSKRPS